MAKSKARSELIDTAKSWADIQVMFSDTVIDGRIHELRETIQRCEARIAELEQMKASRTTACGYPDGQLPSKS